MRRILCDGSRLQGGARRKSQGTEVKAKTERVIV